MSIFILFRFRIVTLELGEGKKAFQNCLSKTIEKAEKYEDPDEMAAFMRMIAESNGGTCLEIRKPYLDLRDDA